MTVTKYRLQLYCFEPGACEDYAWVEVDALDISPEIIAKMEEMGIISIRDKYIRVDHVRRIYQTLRLKKALGINLPSAGIILELLDQVNSLKEELDELKKIL